MPQKFYITTPIYYTNAKGHIGHAYTTIVADILARFKRLQGNETFFLTGTDEHGQKIADAAKAAGKNPKEFCDEISSDFKEMWKKLKISNDYFVRTTDERHEKAVKKFLLAMKESGNIYKGKYTGLYCRGCEKYILEKDLKEGKCPDHLKEPEQLTEENYFFELSKYQQKVTDLIESGQMQIFPIERQNETLSFLKNEKLQDLAISRPAIEWGIKLPWDEKHTIYVWVDALLNYLSAIGYEDDAKQFSNLWPADVHLLGKDILRFHCIIWPAMLLSVKMPTPKLAFVHGYFTVNGQKMSKSLGNAIDPVHLSNIYGIDALRYFLVREISFGQDGDFSEAALKQRYEAELANSLGNLLNRTIVMIEKYFSGKIPEADEKLSAEIDKDLINLASQTYNEATEHFDSLSFGPALSSIWHFINVCNRYINETEPWVLAKNKDARLGNVLYNLAESLRIIAILISPVLIESAPKILSQLGLSPKFNWEDAGKFGNLKPNSSLGKQEILFPKVDDIIPKETPARQISFSIGKDVKAKGVNGFMAVLSNLSIKKKHMGLEKLKNQVEAELKSHDIKEDKIINSYKALRKPFKLENLPAPAEHLLSLIQSKGKLPNINTLVDSYNIVSAKSSLSFGAHDLEKLQGNIRLILCKGNETFIPLDSTQPVKVNAGEYASIDEKQIICRLDIKQCEETKITDLTKNAILYVTGTPETNDAQLKKALEEAGELIVKYCGGQYKIL